MKNFQIIGKTKLLWPFLMTKIQKDDLGGRSHPRLLIDRKDKFEQCDFTPTKEFAFTPLRKYSLSSIGLKELSNSFSPITQCESLFDETFARKFAATNARRIV